MGTTYSNCQVRADSQEAVVAVLTGLLKEPAYVAPAVGGWVGVYPEGDGDTADKLAKKLSAKLACGVFFWSVYDSDIFFYTLYENGKKRDEFDSNPEYFESVSAAKRARLRGKPEALVPYCLPGIGYSQVLEVLQPLLSEDTGFPLGEPALSEKLALLARLLNPTPGAIEAEIAETRRRKYMFADEQASDLAKLLGIAEGLEATEYRDIAEAKGTYANREYAFTGLDVLSPKNLRKKLWELPMVVEEIKAALDQGADPNEISKYGQLFFLHAVSKGAPEVVQLLLDAGGNANAATTKKIEYQYDERGVTALMVAVMGGANSEMGPDAANSAPQIKTVQILLDAGADVNARSESGMTALSAAQGRLRGFSSKKSDRYYSEAVIAECIVRNTTLVEMLRAAGATE